MKKVISIMAFALIAFVATSGDVEARLAAPGCQISTQSGDIVVKWSGKVLFSTDRDQTHYYPYTYKKQTVPAGKYKVMLQAWDGYEGRQNVSQPREYYHVQFDDASSKFITQSRRTGDVPDRKKEAQWRGTVDNELVISRTATHLYAKHSAYVDRSSPNSVVPICMVLRPIKDPIDGKCNSQYNGKELDSKPSGKICTTGAASSVSGNGSKSNPWKWSCAGAHGGKTVQCSATKKPDPVVCGNGKVETGEQCDDGNTKNHDGCSNQCKIENPDIEIMKYDAKDGNDQQTINKGEKAYFEIVVKNTGQVDLKDVKVTDAKEPSCNHTVGNLAVGASSTPYKCESSDVQESFTNTANVVGTPVNGGGNVTDSDPTDVDVIVPGTPSISIDKDDQDNSDDTQTIDKGGKAKFTIVVTNTGSVDLKDVKVTDAKEPSCNQTIGDLAVGESKTIKCTGSARDAGYTNTAAVVGTPVDGQNDVSDSDDTVIVIRTPQGPICGNGIKEEGEACDDGNTNNSDACTNQCTRTPQGPICGNGIVETGEECDGGSNCSSSCEEEEKKKKCKAEIGNTVWNDRNKNGIQDNGEEGISGVRVKLLEGNDYDYDTTDSNGRYKFDDLCADTYRVIVAAETLPEGCYQTYDKNGPLDHKSKHKLDRKEEYKKADFGYYCPTRVVNRTSPATGAGAAATGAATLLASGAAYMSYRRTRKDALSTIIDIK